MVPIGDDSQECERVEQKSIGGSQLCCGNRCLHEATFALEEEAADRCFAILRFETVLKPEGGRTDSSSRCARTQRFRLSFSGMKRIPAW